MNDADIAMRRGQFRAAVSFIEDEFYGCEDCEAHHPSVLIEALLEPHVATALVVWAIRQDVEYIGIEQAFKGRGETGEENAVFGTMDSVFCPCEDHSLIPNPHLSLHVALIDDLVSKYADAFLDNPEALGTLLTIKALLLFWSNDYSEALQVLAAAPDSGVRTLVGTAIWEARRPGWVIKADAEVSDKSMQTEEVARD